MATEGDMEWEEWNPAKGPFLRHMMAGSIAGLAEHIAIFPIDTLKTHIQCERCGSTSVFQTWNCAAKLVGSQGVFRLWRGVSTMLAGCVPAHAAYFSIYETMKVGLGADKPGHHPIGAAECGAAATIAHDLFMTPFDTIKQRMQLGYYRSVLHCLKSMAREEGIRALYLSFPTTLVMNVPYGCIMVATNESLRTVINPSGDFNAPSYLLAGSTAGCVAAFCTTPLDVIKTRLQTQQFQPCPLGTVGRAVPSIHGSSPALLYGSQINISSSRDAATVILREAGVAGFWRGAFPRMLVHAPSVAISWTAYETIKSFLIKYS